MMCFCTIFSQLYVIYASFLCKQSRMRQIIVCHEFMLLRFLGIIIILGGHFWAWQWAGLINWMGKIIYWIIAYPVNMLFTAL